MADLTCEFDKTTNTATITDKKGIAVMFGQNMQDVSNSAINRIFGAKPNQDFEGTAITPNGDKVGDFSVKTVSKDKIVCEGGGVQAFGMKPK